VRKCHAQELTGWHAALDGDRDPRERVAAVAHRRWTSRGTREHAFREDRERRCRAGANELGQLMEQSPVRSNVRAIDAEAPLGEFRIGVCVRRKSLNNPLVAAFWESTVTAARFDEGRAGGKAQRALG
jgi:hypothetical protein